MLRSELEKLCACADGGTITREMIQDLVLPTVSATTFSLAGAVVQQRATAAMQALEQLFTMRVERPVLLAALNSAFLDFVSGSYCRSQSHPTGRHEAGFRLPL